MGHYPAEGLTGMGVVGGERVPCITPELQLRHHLGYRWDENDVHDMMLLADKFALSLPRPYSRREPSHDSPSPRTENS
jgi:lincosamide nucleotidyltransferase A/C/D/E